MTRPTVSFGDMPRDNWGACELAIEVLEQMQVAASLRCARLIREYLTMLATTPWHENGVHISPSLDVSTAAANGEMGTQAEDDSPQKSLFCRLQAALYGAFQDIEEGNGDERAENGHDVGFGAADGTSADSGSGGNGQTGWLDLLNMPDDPWTY